MPHRGLVTRTKAPGTLSRALSARPLQRVKARHFSVPAASAADAAFGDGREDAAQARQHTPASHAADAERRRLWLAAIKPPMYSVGIVPVLVRQQPANAGASDQNAPLEVQQDAPH
jgi:hypothetical protein